METKKPATPAPLIAYKGFDKDMRCRGFQFEVGKTYTHDGPVELCSQGFHACEHPMDVWSYYPLGESRYAVVELGGATDEKSDDTKRVGSSLTVKAEIDIAGIVKAAVEWTKKHAGGKSVAEGDSSSAASSGNSSSAASSGDSSSAASSGNSSSAASSGDSSSAASSGDSSSAASSGNYSRAASSGNSSSAASSGDSSSAASSGNYSRAASSGNSSSAASSGNYSSAASSGNSSRAASSGNSSSAASSGNSSRAASSGEQTIAMVAGCAGRARAGHDGCIALAWHDGKRPRIVVGYVGEGIDADTWYRVEKGQLVKV